jgi:FtsP/CotA-like multicopper oxidase with cupredoxin domain
MHRSPQPFTLRLAARTIALGLATLGLGLALAGGAAAQPEPLDPLRLTKYLDPLPVPGPMPMAGANYYEIGMYEVVQQLHSQLPPTRVWGYGTSQATASYPAATIEALRNVPTQVRWTNHLPMTHLLEYAIDRTLHTAHWMDGVPVAVHVHGAEVEPGSDGGPDAWFTQDFAEKGPGWTQEVHNYANTQLPATIWYHDHVLGITRLNVYAGLAGFYLIRDPAIEGPLNLPSGPYEIPMAIQDRMFFTDGQLMYPVGGDNPEIHPLWQPEFFGNTILVNGKVWPYLEVEPRKYRFRMLNGSNARFYAMQMVEDATDMPGPGFWQIGSDGGYLDAPVLLADPADPDARRLVMGPGERADVIVDFSGYAPGTSFTLRNNAKSPFPNGTTVDPRTTGQVMQFRVVPLTAPDESAIGTPGAGYVERLANATNVRQLTLDEVMGANGPIAALLNNTAWDAPATELPELGSTEIWRIVNTTGDAHPIHIHLTQFQLVSRQRYKVKKFLHDYMGDTVTEVDGSPSRMADEPGPAPDVTAYLTGMPTPPPPEEAGWKDTFRMLPGQVTTLIVRFAPQDGDPAYAFDATAEPGYVWHCHILEHEDNEMMRPYHLQAPSEAAASNGPATEQRPTPVTDEPTLASGPNPFAARTVIHFVLPQPGRAAVRIYGVDGRLVRVLVDREFAAGEHSVAWDGSGPDGARLPNGVYFARTEAAGAQKAVKVVLAR